MEAGGETSLNYVINVIPDAPITVYWTGATMELDGAVKFAEKLEVIVKNHQRR